VNGRAVTADETVSYLIANTQVGARVPVEIFRGGRRQTVQVTVAQRPSEEELAKQANAGGGGFNDQGATNGNTQATPATTSLGLSLQVLTPDIARAVNLPATARGVIIAKVDPDSDAAEKGLQRGDLIISVNQQAVTTPAQIVAQVDAARRAGRTSVLLLVKRGANPEAFFGIDLAR
jgi:serine protease Do